MGKKNVKKKKTNQEHQDASIKPAPETLGKTDPQENMKGPLSSIMNKGGALMNNKEDKEEARKKHDNRM